MRTLPLRLAPVEGESLPGYVARYSHTFQFPPGDVLRALALDGGCGIVLAARRYGVWLCPNQIEHVAVAAGIDPATVERMLLSRYAGRAFKEPAQDLDAAFAAAAHAHEVLIRCSRFCPHCLHENGAWLVGWQLGWSFVCVAHGVVLSAAAQAAARYPSVPCATGGPVTTQAPCPTRHAAPIARDEGCAAASSRAPIRRQRVRRRSRRNTGSTRCSTASSPRHSAAFISTRRSTSVTCSRSATCCTGILDRSRKQPNRVCWGTGCMTIRGNSRRCCHTRSRSRISPTLTR